MIIIEIIVLAIVLLISLFAFWLSLSFFFGAPFVTTPKKIIKEIISLAKINTKDVVIDLGSGDGRIIIETAKVCKKSIGYEINPFLVLWSKLFAYLNGVGNKTEINFKNYQKANLKDGTVIVLYSIRGHLPQIEIKLKKELKPGTKIISYKFPLRNFKLFKKTNSGVYLYKI